MQFSVKVKKHQQGFTLIEAAFLIFFFALGIIGGIYYINQEREFTAANLIAKQLLYIADNVAQFSWPAAESKIQDYSISDLESLGVISSKVEYKLPYRAKLFWQDKNTYTELIYISPVPSFDIEQLMSISGLTGDDGGYINKQGEIVMSSSHLYNNIKVFSGKNMKIPYKTPIVLKLIKNPPSPQITNFTNIKESLFEWGKMQKKNYLTNSEQNSVIVWKPAFIDDRVIISWDNEVDKYVAIVKDAKSGNILSKRVDSGKEYVLVPRMAWVGKKIVLSIFIGNGIRSAHIIRTYDIHQPQYKDNFDINVSFKAYLPTYNDQLAPLENKVVTFLDAGTPVIVCLTSFSVKVLNGQSVDYHRFLVPTLYNIQLDYLVPSTTFFVSGKRTITTGIITALPYMLPEFINPDYETMGGGRCSTFSETLDSHSSVRILKIYSDPTFVLSERMNQENIELNPKSSPTGYWSFLWD
ncbi:hypothetical protein ECIG_04720 [Escherichia coli M605]|uniref:Uncharacterized protein n=1 Tax=Escherichia coli M605 TaxID=656417 RepID=F4SY80_ECOLX|nr:hypothetical protein [Escherichia coli]EGI16327.1 hypothetical protein ECIG_04720 [Escherichia coli M605]